jgi:hypothetical protein
MTTNQTIAMLWPLVTLGAVALTSYGITRWVKSQRRTPERAEGDHGSFVVERQRIQAIYDKLRSADAIIREAQRDLQALPKH